MAPKNSTNFKRMISAGSINKNGVAHSETMLFILECEDVCVKNRKRFKSYSPTIKNIVIKPQFCYSWVRKRRGA
jgi:hypothetical protein